MHSYTTDNDFRVKLLAVLGIGAYLFSTGLNELVFPVFVGWISVIAPAEISLGISSMLVFSGIYWLFASHLWRQPWIPSTVVSVPDLNGHWEGHIKTNFEGEIDESYISADDDPDDNRYTAMNATLDIKQTWRKINFSFKTGRSPSYSTGTNFQMNEAVEPKVAYQFQNEGPLPDKQSESEGEYDGAAQFRYLQRDDAPDVLEGYYYTGPSRGNNYGTARFVRENDSV